MYTYRPRRRQSLSPPLLLLPVLLLAALATFQLSRAAPPLETTPVLEPSLVLGEPRQLPLPPSGASIVAVEGLGTIGGHAEDVQRPIASVTKVMTARIVLKEAPLRPGESGPTLTLTAADASRYWQMIAEDQSALPVAAGMRLTQLELLQGLLVPSANNFAEILAVWNAGSLEAFVAKMNAEARALGMNSTTYADVSGFSPRSVSTARDQLVLERLMMQDPVFAGIVGLQTVRLPGIGVVANVNQALGQDGIIGIKTGYTEEAGGNLAFASRRQVGGRSVEIVGAVFGQPDRPAAFDATRRLLSSLGSGLQVARVIAAGQAVATIKPPWGSEVGVVVDEDVEMLLWPGMSLASRLEWGAITAPLPAGAQVGWLILTLGEQERRLPVRLAADLASPGLLWRLSRF